MIFLSYRIRFKRIDYPNLHPRKDPRMRTPTLLALCCLFGASHCLRAEFLVSTEGVESLGSFSGSISYASSQSSQGTLTVQLTNTSPGGNGGYLTAFAFNLPQADIDAVLFSSSDPDFVLLNPSLADNGINASPFGHFDLGASLGSGFQGGGAPSKGIAVNQEATFTFTLQGQGLDLLDPSDFLAELSQPPGIGEGAKAFVARFRGFNNGGSDKVPGEAADGEIQSFDQPEPSSLLLLGLGCLVVVIGYRVRVTRRGSPAV
jgi:hypothetical protein